MAAMLALAGTVLVYVAFPHRGRDTRQLAWLTDPLARLGDRVRPRGSVPPAGLLSSPERDERIRGRFERAERLVVDPLGRVVHPFADRRQRSLHR